MSSKLTCYCGETIPPKSVSHLMNCSYWKHKSPLYQAAIEYTRQGKQVEFLLLECEAVKETFMKHTKPKELDLAPVQKALYQAVPLEEEKIKLCDETLECGICQKRSSDMNDFFFPDECFHIQCKSHAIQAVRRQYPKSNRARCPMPKCRYIFNSEEICSLIGSEELEHLKDMSLKAFIEKDAGILAHCVCGEASILEPGSVDFSYKDENGNPVSREAAEHMAKFRLRCRVCSHITCVNCKVDPYHLGFTCEQFKNFKSSKRCVYCDKVIMTNEKVCKDIECKNRYKRACGKDMPCGHKCAGVKREDHCLGCLKEDCTQHGSNEHCYCAICYTEDLGAAPCVRLVCGHILHYHCIRTALEKRWVGPRITFNFAKCPMCKAWVETSDRTLTKLMTSILRIYKTMKAMMLKRLKFENMESDKRLQDPNDHYFHKPEAYAFDRLNYYECFKCKQPYFGGKKECDDPMNRDEYKPEELVCPSCSAIGVEGRDCPTHGKEFIEFKCKFCCSIACWFCWGNTHFCDSCHTQQNNGNYLTKKKKEELPVCNGASSCPLKVDHPPNGGEHALGCSVCRNMKSNHQGF